MTESFVDRLYTGLGIFTGIYLLSITLEFFGLLHAQYPTVELFLSALQEPYLATLAIYVILKELRRQHMHNHFSLHRGEHFVVMWLLLLVATSYAVLFTKQYQFDLSYRLVISNSLASLIIFLGSRLQKQRLP